MSRLAVIGGGSGFVGRALTKKLQSNGYKVSIISRKPQKSSATLQYISWDEVKENGLPSKTSVVVNLAGRLVGDPAKSWNESYKDDVIKSRVQTTSLLASAIRQCDHPPHVFVSTSAIGYYPPSASIEYTEDTPLTEEQANANWFTHMCRQWEAASDISDSNTRHCIARLGVVLGKDGGLIGSVLLPFKLCLGGCLSDGSHWFTWIHIHDAVDAIYEMIQNQELSGPFNVTAPNPVPYKEMVKALSHHLNRPAWNNTPQVLVKWLFGEERARDLILANQRILPSRLLNEAKFTFSHPNIDSAISCIVNTDDKR